MHLAAQSVYALTSQQQDTFRFLGAGSNLASVSVLGHALRSPVDSIRLAALQTLIARGGDLEMSTILEHIDRCQESELPLLADHVSSLIAPVEAGLASDNPEVRQRSIFAIAKLQIASQFHHLVQVAQSPQDPQQILAAELLVSMASKIGADARLGFGRAGESAREQLLADLSRSMSSYGEHRVSQVFEAWLCASHWNDESFKDLFDPDRRDQVAKTALKQMRHSHRREIVELIAGILWSNGPRYEAVKFAGERKDHAVACALADHMHHQKATPQLIKNMRNEVEILAIQEFDFSSTLESISRRTALLQLLAVSHVSPAKLLGSINAMLVETDPGVEKACGNALRSLKSLKPEIVVMVLSDCFESPDMEPCEPPPWKTELKAEIERLIELYPAQPSSIRSSIEFAFSDFQCDVLSQHLENWPESHLLAYGKMLRIAQRDYVEYLEREAASQSAAKRIRALRMVRMIGVESDLLEIVKDLLNDKNDAVRIEAIYSVAAGRNRREAISLLQPFLKDEDNGVKVAADLVLSQLGG
jgi:HEAT repeat protein